MAKYFLHQNPFTPSFGEVPPYMAGRADVISSLVRAFESQHRSPYLTCAISGARGTGKTALISLAALEAEGRGWVSANVTALPGMLEDIYERACDASAHLLEGEGARLSSLSVAGVGASWEYPRAEGRNWRSRMGALLDGLAEHDTGLLITVDEARADLDELVQLVAVYQHFVREQRKVGLLLAGLPRNMSQLISSESTSFLRRAQAISLGCVPDFEVELALRRSFELGGRAIDDDALAHAVASCEGFPFMIQLVGYRSWEASEHTAGNAVRLEDAEEGVRIARMELRERVLGPSYHELSGGDKAFLRAMLEDEGESVLAEIAQRMGKSNSYAAQYKRRLLDLGVIEEHYDRSLDFALPAMRDFVAEMG